MTIESLLTEILIEIKGLREDLNKKESTEVQVHQGKKYYTIKEWCKKHSWPSEGGMRHIIFNEVEFKAQDCFKRVRRRVLIDEEKFLKWFETNPHQKHRDHLRSK